MDLKSVKYVVDGGNFNLKTNKMKITIESYGKTHTSEFDNDDVSIDEYINTFYALLIATTFHEKTIIEGFEYFLEQKRS